MRRALIPVLMWALAGEAWAIRLVSPPDGARPRSAYIVIEGEAAPSAQVEAFDGAAPLAKMQADAAGRFERVVRLAPGEHQLHLTSSTGEATVQVAIGTYPAPKPAAPYELLQTGDVLLAHDRNSQQEALYHPMYTHSALYIGPDVDGAALVLEAVSDDNATLLGPVAAVRVEACLPWRDADRIDVFRLAGGMTGADRVRMVAWAHKTAARGLPFRGAEYFGDLYRAWLLWDPKRDRPLDAAQFQELLAGLRQRVLATDAYDCATLVWHAFRDNTAAHIDLADPNRVVWGAAAQHESKRLMATLQPLLILPDSFALSGKLRLVAAQ